MAEQNNKSKRDALRGYCSFIECEECPIKEHGGCRVLKDLPDDEIGKLFEAVFPSQRHRITIRDLIDLLDYDRTGIRSVRIVDEETKNTDTLWTDSYLLQYVEDTPVNTLDTVGGVLTMYVEYGKGGDTDG